MSMETDDLLERSRHEAESEDNEEPELKGGSSSSSSDESNEFGPNNVTSIQARPPSLQGHQERFQSGPISIPHAQQGANIALANLASAGTSGEFFPPTIVDSSQQAGIHSLDNPEQHMSLLHPNHPSLSSTNGDIPSAQNVIFLVGNDDRQIVPSPIGNRAGQQSSSCHPVGMENHGGYIFPANEAMQNFGKGHGAINPYHLPISNLPSEFRLESSSRVHVPPQILQQDPQTMPDRGDGGFRKPQWTSWPPQSQTSLHGPPTANGTQEIQFQGLLDQSINGPSNFFAGAGSSSHAQVPNMPNQPGMGPYVSGSSLPFSFECLPSSSISKNKLGSHGNFVNYNQFEAGESSLRSPKRKMARQGDNNLPPSPSLQLGSWFSEGQNSFNNNPTTSQSSRSVPIRNKCYDPLYEEMGLPIDPHLRMFMARRDNGDFGDRFS